MAVPPRKAPGPPVGAHLPWSCQWAQPQDAGGHAHALLHGWKPFSVSVTLPRFTTPASFGLDRQLGTYSVPSSAPRRSGPGAGESIPTRRSRGSRENGEHARVNVHGQQHRGCERLRRAADLRSSRGRYCLCPGATGPGRVGEGS